MKDLAPFSDPEAVKRYAEGPQRIVPGLDALHRMITLLLAERVPPAGRVLVIGAGGGLELKAFAEGHPGWTFDGVDPSREMLNLAQQNLGPLGSRVRLHHGYIQDAPPGPFDGATCLLTLHFVPLEEKRRLASEVRRRLKPGAPFVTAHLSFPQAEGEQAEWFSRYAAYAGMEPEKAQNARAEMTARLSILDPEQDEAILREAGFSKVSLFYAAFAFRGWVAYA